MSDQPQPATKSFDPSIAANRRRFFLERAFRLRTKGSGSDLDRLMQGPRSNKGLVASKVFGEIPVMLIGAHAANAYMPPRYTTDVDFLVLDEQFADGEKVLRNAGWTKSRDLMFPNAKLGLYGSAWHHDECGEELDLISSPQHWVTAAFAADPAYDQQGARVLPLPYIVLMKLDSARATDQGDLSRMLGRLDENQVNQIVNLVERHYNDPLAADDIRQFAVLGQWEYERDHGQSPNEHSR